MTQRYIAKITMTQRMLLSLCVAFTVSISALAAPAVKLPSPRIETLPNGLEIVWFVSDSLPVVDIALLVKSGYRDDAAGKTGTSEMVASLLDRGAAGMTAQQIAKAVEELGATRYASADEDTFSMGMHGLANDAPVLLDLLSKMALKPDFLEAEVKREHARLLDRWNHLGDYGETLASVTYRRILSGGSVYGRGGFHSIQEFQNVGRTEIVEYHKRHFAPKNAVLMIVGRVKPEEFKPKIEAAFGSWKGEGQGEAPKREWKKFTDTRLAHKKGQIVLVNRPDLTQAQVRMGFRAPALTHPDHYALVVGNALTGEYFHSRLNTLIRDKLGLTYGIGSSFSYNQDLAYFTISAATRNETAGQLIRKTREVLADLKKGNVPADEVKMAKEYLIGGFPLSTSTLGAVAVRWLSGHVFGLGPDYLNEFVPKVGAVTREQVVAAMAKHFDLEDMEIVVAGDARKLEKELSGVTPAGAPKKITVKDLQ